MAREPWFKFWAADYLTDPDVYRLSLSAQGLLLRMWCACWIHGSLPDDIEEVACLVQIKTSIVSIDYSIVKTFFVERDGRLFSARMERAKEKSEAARESVNRRKYRPVNSDQSNSQSNSQSKSQSQKARKPESQKARRLESQKPEKINTVCAEPEKSSGSTPAAEALPLVDGSSHEVSQGDIACWSELYPAIDVMQQVRAMKGWLIANPKNRKTKSGINRFINAWLCREQNKAKVQHGNQKSASKTEARTAHNREVYEQVMRKYEAEDHPADDGGDGGGDAGGTAEPGGDGHIHAGTGELV